MKYICFILFVVTFLAICDAKSCESSMDCGISECCKDLGLINRCLSLRDEDETCNGKFLCGCKLGYLCEQREESVWNTFKVGTGICKALSDIKWKK